LRKIYFFNFGVKGRKERSGLFIQKQNWTFGMEWNGFVEAIKVKGGILLFLDKENNFSTWQPCCQSLINKENIILVEWGRE
jgi:hypothetical protein